MDVLPGLEPALARRAEAAAQWLLERKANGDTVTVVHHIDADGVTAGAVALECLERAGIKGAPLAARSLDDLHLGRIQDEGEAALWFCDFGSTAYMHFPDAQRLICDHHELVRDGTEEDFAHVNPLLDDLSGQTISGAGCALLAAVAFDAANIDLAPVALVGAAGDLQDRDGGFTGANRVLQDAAVAAGTIEVEDDLAWYGPESRTPEKFLYYRNEPAVPGITNDRSGARALLKRVGAEGPCWSALSPDVRSKIKDTLAARLADCGLESRIDGLTRPVVRLAGEAPGTPLREVREFATLLNSTARYDEPATGLAVARGDRGEALEAAMGLLQGHRQHLAKSIGVFTQAGINDTLGLQWVHVHDSVRDTVVGIVCGMALDGLGLARDRPLVALAYTPEGQTKISGRAPAEIQGRIDLATAMREAAAEVGGQGGGHKGAAGATIPRDGEDAFIARLDAIVCSQLGRNGDATTWQGSGAGQRTLF